MLESGRYLVETNKLNDISCYIYYIHILKNKVLLLKETFFILAIQNKYMK